jgi:hypothetical protein
VPRFSKWLIIDFKDVIAIMDILRISEIKNNAQINDMVSRAMAGRSHKSYFFSI